MASDLDSVLSNYAKKRSSFPCAVASLRLCVPFAQARASALR